ncbi:MAG: multicopper oxidase family protein [Dehalococcoidia bacterium]
MDRQLDRLFNAARQRGRDALPRRPVGRRDLLKLAAGATAFGLVGGGIILPRGGAPRAAAAEPLTQPEVRTSRDGLLDTTLTTSVQPVAVAGRTAIMSTYEGSVPGPTLRVRPGDRLRINLVNNLEQLPDGLPPSNPFLCTVPDRMRNDPDPETTCDTNLHTHGFHVSPSGNSDNIFVRIKAGESFQYEYQIPDNHPSGVYAYHPHLHGTSHIQSFAGLGGAIIVEGDLDRLPGVAGVPERLMVLQATQFTRDGGSVRDFGDGPAMTGGDGTQQRSYLRLVNGQLNPTMTIRPGETQRWRIINLTPNVTYRLHLDGHQLHQIAKDGTTLAAPWTRDEIVMSPGERVEVLIQAGAAGSYALRTLPIATGFTTQVDAALATLVSTGEAMTPQPLPTTLMPFDDLSNARIDGRRQVTFQIKPPIGGFLGAFQVSGQDFDGARDDHVVRLNTTEEWTIRNSSTVWHPFHIHINHYQVVAINGHPVPVRSWEDTTPVPPFGDITIRTRFLDFPGRWVFHCHILVHEDNGMMQTVLALP